MQKLSLEKIKRNLNKELGGKAFNTIPSTSDYLKEIASKIDGDFFVVAESQSGGRGTRGRSFFSPDGGAYLSVLLHPNLIASKMPLITPYVATVLARAIKKVAGVDVKIKWVNDIYLSNKKLAGILTEASLVGNNCGYVIIGVGINIETKNFPTELKNIATSFSLEGVDTVDVNRLIGEFLNGIMNLEEEISSGVFIAEYKEKQLLLGREVTVTGGNYDITGVAVDIASSGALVIKRGCETLEINAGDVSVKL